MPAPLSIILPTLEAARTIGPTLGALTPGLGAGLIRQVVIADGGSTDAIAEVADATGADFVTAPRGRGPQIQTGVAAAKADWLLILHADTVLAPDWPEAVARHIRDWPEAAGWFDLRFDDLSFAARWTAGWANLRSRLFALPYGDQGLLLSRGVYDSIGGCPPIPIMEDVAMVRALIRGGGRRRLRPLGCVATTSADKYRRDGWIRRGARNWGCLARYFLGAPPDRIAALYNNQKAAK